MTAAGGTGRIHKRRVLGQVECDIETRLCELRDRIDCSGKGGEVYQRAENAGRAFRPWEWVDPARKGVAGGWPGQRSDGPEQRAYEMEFHIPIVTPSRPVSVPMSVSSGRDSGPSAPPRAVLPTRPPPSARKVPARQAGPTRVKNKNPPRRKFFEAGNGFAGTRCVASDGGSSPFVEALRFPLPSLSVGSRVSLYRTRA
jgi:hypothetical protein